MFKICTGIAYTDQHIYLCSNSQPFFLNIKVCNRNSGEYTRKSLTISYMEHRKKIEAQRKNKIKHFNA